MIIFDCGQIKDHEKLVIETMLNELNRDATGPNPQVRELRNAINSWNKSYSLTVTKSFHQPETKGDYYYDHITVVAPLYTDDATHLLPDVDNDSDNSDDLEAKFLTEKAKAFAELDERRGFHLYRRRWKNDSQFENFFSFVSDFTMQVVRISYIWQGKKKLSLMSAPSEMLQGYDSISGAGMATAVEGNNVSRGGVSSVEYSIVNSIADLYEKLDVSASLSVGLGGFGNASAKAKFIDELKLTEESLTILVRATHIAYVYTTSSYALKEGLAPENPEQVDAFVHQYGDSFISELRLGAEYYAVYTFYSQTRGQKKEIEATLAANGIGSFGKVNADFQSKLNAVVDKVNTATTFKQNISGIDNPKLPDPEKLVQFALDFLTIPVNAPAVISYQSKGYEHVPGVQVEVFRKVKQNRRYFGENSDYSVALGRVTELLNKLNLIREVYRFYNYDADTKADTVFYSAKQDKSVLCKQLHEYEDSPLSQFQLPDLPSLAHGVPSLSFKVLTSETKGGNGGDAFDDINISTYVEQMTRISKIEFQAGERIDRVDITYQSEGQTAYTKMHGGGGGRNHGSLQLRRGVFINSISGRCGEEIDALKIRITDGQQLEAGGGGGRSFELQNPFDTAVCIGFKGRSGTHLDQIQAVYIAFMKATWSEN